jgi:hypothetical protein
MIHRPRRLVGQRAAAADERSAKVAEDAVTSLKDGHRVSAKRFPSPSRNRETDREKVQDVTAVTI